MRLGDFKRGVYILLGSLCLILGAIGIIIPLLPTTPFWLLACWFYVRSSPFLYNQVIQNQYVGRYLKDYLEDHSISITTKATALAVMWSSFLYTAFILEADWWIDLLLLLISIGVSWHILSIRTRKK
jgi:hypothetical protein